MRRHPNAQIHDIWYFNKAYGYISQRTRGIGQRGQFNIYYTMKEFGFFQHVLRYVRGINRHQRLDLVTSHFQWQVPTEGPLADCTWTKIPLREIVGVQDTPPCVIADVYVDMEYLLTKIKTAFPGFSGIPIRIRQVDKLQPAIAAILYVTAVEMCLRTHYAHNAPQLACNAWKVEKRMVGRFLQKWVVQLTLGNKKAVVQLKECAKQYLMKEMKNNKTTKLG